MQTSRRALDRLLDPQEYQRDAAHPATCRRCRRSTTPPGTGIKPILDAALFLWKLTIRQRGRCWRSCVKAWAGSWARRLMTSSPASRWGLNNLSIRAKVIRGSFGSNRLFWASDAFREEVFGPPCPAHKPTSNFEQTSRRNDRGSPYRSDIAERDFENRRPKLLNNMVGLCRLELQTSTVSR